MTDAALAERRLLEVAALERPAQAKRMLVIVNPVATTMSDRLKHLVVYALQGRYQVTAIDTQRKGHAIDLCREAAEQGFDVVVAFGGDGTVNEAANGLAGFPTPLTCLPGGSNNVFCKMLGIPNDVVDATEHLLRMPDHWEPRAVDLGRVNGRWFTFAAGVGLDASVVERVDGHPHLKARYGAWYYSAAAVATFLRRYVVGPPRLELELDGRRVRGRERVPAERLAVHVLQDPPGGPGRGCAARLGRARRRDAHPRAAVRRAHRDVPSAVRSGPDRQAPRRRGVHRRAPDHRALARRPAGADAGRRRLHRRRGVRRDHGRPGRAAGREPSRRWA